MSHVEQLRRRFAYVLIAVLWTNAVLLAFAVLVTTPRNANLLIGGGVVLAALGTLAWLAQGTNWPARQITSIATQGQVMLLLYAFAEHPYQADMHMYFFAMLAVLAGWLDWRVFVPTALAIAVHHSLLGVIQPAAVFPNGSSAGRVLLHAVIVIVQAAALGWTTLTLRVALETSEGEHKAATDAKLMAEHARNEVAATTRQAALERQAMLDAVADDFEGRISVIAKDVISSVETLRTASQQMMAGATEVAERSGAVALSSQQTTFNVVAVANATDRLALSIGEIDQQVAQTALIVGSTTESARTVVATVNQLSKKADDINAIVALISDIAARTNLLALNAAIEAARFGHAGSGFAVVAQEVKLLANQTSQATKNVQDRIEAIRGSSEDAIRAIDAMNQAIGSLNEVSATVAAVIEQQNIATTGIASNIEIAAEETIAASRNIEIVSRFAAETGDAATFVADSADRLAEQSVHLDREVAQFLGRIRTA